MDLINVTSKNLPEVHQEEIFQDLSRACPNSPCFNDFPITSK